MMMELPLLNLGIAVALVGLLLLGLTIFLQIRHTRRELSASLLLIGQTLVQTAEVIGKLRSQSREEAD